MYFAECQFCRSLFASERGLPTPDKFFPQKQPNVKWRSTNNFFLKIALEQMTLNFALSKFFYLKNRPIINGIKYCYPIIPLVLVEGSEILRHYPYYPQVE
jgi:hypothetical protein